MLGTNRDWDAAAMAAAFREAQEAQRYAMALCRAARRTRASVAALLDRARENQAVALRLVGGRTGAETAGAASIARPIPGEDASRAFAAMDPHGTGPASAATGAVPGAGGNGPVPHPVASEAPGPSPPAPDPTSAIEGFGPEDLDDVVNGLIDAYRQAEAAGDAEGRRRYGALLMGIGRALADYLGPRASGLTLN